MNSYDWNGDWTQEPDVLAAATDADHPIAKMFREAYVERIVESRFLNPSLDISAVGGFITPGAIVIDFWFFIALEMAYTHSGDGHEASVWARNLDDAGNPVDLRTHEFVDSWAFRATDFDSTGDFNSNFQRANGAAFTPFPPEGLTRKFPREIFAMSNPGTDGDVARFICVSNPSSRPFRSAKTTDPLFGSFDSTPIGEIYKDQPSRHVRRVAGEWVSTGENPDMITEAKTDGIYYGDYFGGHILNQIRDALNRFVWHPIPLGITSVLISAPGQRPIFGLTRNVGFANLIANTPGTFDSFGVLPNRFGINRKVEFYYKSDLVGGPDAPQFFHPANPLWLLLKDFGSTAGTNFTADLPYHPYGPFLQGAPWPPVVALVKYDVPGGFRWTKLTPAGQDVLPS